MSESEIVVYGTKWCWDCRVARKFFDRNKIDYTWVNIDKNKEAEEFVLKVNNGMRSVPTIRLPDGSILVEPSAKQLKEKLINSN